MAGAVGCNGSSSDDGGESSSFRQLNNNHIRPGVEISSRNGSCTSNFLYFLNAHTYYIGTAAHCFSPDSNSGVDPCESRNEPLGFDGIRIENASRPGVLVYTSWGAMQQNGEQPGSDTCAFNDFALVRIHADDLDNIFPATIHFGGPTALFRGLAAVGDTVFSYGRSPLHAGIEDLQAKEGQITSVHAGGWSYRISADSPGVSGDSGSPVLHQSGAALAVLTDIGVGIGLQPVTNGAVNLEKALAYAKQSGFIHPDVAVATWPEFSP